MGDIKSPGVYTAELDLKVELEVAKRSWEEALGLPAHMFKQHSNFTEAENRCQQFAEQYGYRQTKGPKAYFGHTGGNRVYREWVYRNWVPKNLSYKEDGKMDYEVRTGLTVAEVLGRDPCGKAKVLFQSWCFENEYSKAQMLGEKFLQWVQDCQPNNEWITWLWDQRLIDEIKNEDFEVAQGDFVKLVNTPDLYFRDSIYLVHQISSRMGLMRVHSGNGTTPVGSNLCTSCWLEVCEKVTISKLLKDCDFAPANFIKLENAKVVEQ